MKSKILCLAVVVLLCGCDPEVRWVSRNVPMTDAERKAIAEHAERILAATPGSLAGHDQDWDDAIAQAHYQGRLALCRGTLWEQKSNPYSGVFRDTGRWRYSDDALGEVTQRTEGAKASPEAEYARGVNDALDSIMLLNLELDMKSERKTWGEMAGIVAERLKVKRADITKP